MMVEKKHFILHVVLPCNVGIKENLQEMMTPKKNLPSF